ncbi:serine/threonine-protein kinase [Nannocystis bainbridge]|uniref:Serine/threonine-protein kinase n=1 Tax=Nannocystis bainbridge TaxID=2995303 RepID=A0ABT5DNY9_9BACT|nr:serine/threonine-protein kinase [Nannocystis bainbridge]MDC0715251.1 serine/threonine-protein kinase [Nannocystis bainbridge]
MEGRETQASALEDTATRQRTPRPGTSLANAPTLLGDATPRQPSDAPELPIGAEVGRYKITGRIGAGGMGVVYRAYDPQLDREIALKLLLAGAEVGTEGRNRMLREAQAAAKIRHPNVVTVFDAGEVGGRVFIAMELIAGSTLKGWLRQAPRTWQEIVAIMLMAGEGLVAAHAAGLVHRDFKPDNVLVGVEGRAHVLDFGLARPALDAAALPTAPAQSMTLRPGREALLQSLTLTGMTVGTPAYMAPEQHLARPSSARSDQFSFCVATYEALYGLRPFKGESYSELSMAVIDGRVVPPPRRSKVPPAVWHVLRRGLQADPDARYPALAQLLADLDAAVRAGAARPRYGLWAVGVVAPLLAGLAYMSGTPGEPRDPGDLPRPPPATAGPDARDVAPTPTPTLPSPPAVGQAGVALMKTQHVDLAALHELLASVVPREAAQLELGSEGLGLVGPAATAWKEPLDQLAQAVDSQRRTIGELVRVSAPNGLWAAYEVGVEGIDRKQTAVAALDDVEAALSSATLGVLLVRAPFKAQEGVTRWLRSGGGEAQQFKEWCYNNPSLKKTECAKTLRDCEYNAIAWEEGAEAAEAAKKGRARRKYCHGKA